MVEFGKTLNEVVKKDWRCHAVAYMELKRTLSESHNQNNNNNDFARDSGCGINGVNGCVDPAAANNETNDNDDAHSVHTESSYCISETQKANFFRIYEDSVARLTKFYQSRVEWAREEMGALEKVMGRRAMAEDEGTNEGADDSTSFLLHRVTNFSKDLNLVLEFLELNSTAFSKIMKKFDKRTGSALREDKLRELKAEHPYLYDGGELKKCKNKCKDWIMQLQLLLQKDCTMVAGHLKEHFQSSSSSQTRNSTPGPSSQNTLFVRRSSRMAQKKEEEPVEESHHCENPQESSEETKKAHPIPKEIQAGAKKKAPRSVHKTKDSRLLQEMIDRVNEELCMQKADSPFFDQAVDDNPPLSFMNSEVDLADELGQGEFCKIYEVSRFTVPESCHICFLHRGYNDPDPNLKAVPSTNQPTHRKIPSTVNVSDLNLNEKESKPTSSARDDHPLLLASQSKKKSQQHARTSSQSPSIFSFNYDANISDYDDLESDHEDEDYEHTTRGFMKDHCLRNGEARYAIKRIRSNLVGQENITDAAVDLAREAEFLAALKHPNIIRIRGTINTPGHPKYSIILDRLYDTLELQMNKWRVDAKRYKGKFKGLIGKNKAMLEKMWMDRLVAAYDVSRAMAYLHGRGILHRDIKPANIGFDIRGDIKIFDFGLAKELKPSEREGEDKYRTSGLAGTRRYMAPEVVQVMPYGLSSDVYSFGVLMWEMLMLKPAYEKYSRQMHYKEVVVEGKRPKINKSWPFVIKNLLERCWHKLPHERPSFQSVCELIKFGLPNENVASERSDDLMLRSVRSKQGCDDMRVEDFMDSDHNQVNMNVPDETENIFSHPTDSMSQSVRIKSHHLRKHE